MSKTEKIKALKELLTPKAANPDKVYFGNPAQLFAEIPNGTGVDIFLPTIEGAKALLKLINHV
jgi:uncharacterized protein YvpB